MNHLAAAAAAATKSFRLHISLHRAISKKETRLLLLNQSAFKLNDWKIHPLFCRYTSCFAMPFYASPLHRPPPPWPLIISKFGTHSILWYREKWAYTCGQSKKAKIAFYDRHSIFEFSTISSLTSFTIKTPRNILLFHFHRGWRTREFARRKKNATHAIHLWPPDIISNLILSMRPMHTTCVVGPLFRTFHFGCESFQSNLMIRNNSCLYWAHTSPYL